MTPRPLPLAHVSPQRGLSVNSPRPQSTARSPRAAVSLRLQPQAEPQAHRLGEVLASRQPGSTRHDATRPTRPTLRPSLVCKPCALLYCGPVYLPGGIAAMQDQHRAAQRGGAGVSGYTSELKIETAPFMNMMSFQLHFTSLHGP